MKDVLSQFWGDAIDIDDDAALTWMRQKVIIMLGCIATLILQVWLFQLLGILI